MRVEVTALEKDLVLNVSVSSNLIGFETGDHGALEARLASWRRHNMKLGLTGAMLASGEGIAIILEGTESSIAKVRRHVDAKPADGDVQLLAQSVCLKRRFAAWPLAYVGPSRWVQRALAGRALADMTTQSSADAEFLIDLVLSFVGDGA